MKKLNFKVNGNFDFIPNTIITGEVKKPFILSNQFMFDMSDDLLDSYLELLTTYAELHGVERDAIDAIFRTSIIIGLRKAEAEAAKQEGSPDNPNDIEEPESKPLAEYDAMDSKTITNELQKYLDYFKAIGLNPNIPADFGYIYMLFMKMCEKSISNNL